MKIFRLLPVLAAVSAALSLPAHAQSLIELYQSARSFDASYLSAKSQFDASLAKADQARAAILPTVGMSASVSRSLFSVDKPPLDYSFGSQNIGLSASQPLYRPANWALASQGEKQVGLAQGQLIAAEQDLIVRVSQAYFDVLAATDNLTFVRAQKTAVAEQLASAKRNFEVGTATITDTREAQAQFDLVVAQEIAADYDLRVKKLALDLLAGKTNSQPSILATPVVLPELAPVDVGVWVNQSEAAHPGIMQAQMVLDIAKLETEKARAGSKPTLDLTGSYGVTQNNGSATNLSDYRTNVATLGLSFNLPLFAGYSIQNRLKETLALEEKAGSDLEGSRRLVSQATRAAFFGILSGQGQVKALEAAEASSQSALDANKLGYQVGVRINIDVLNSQSQLYSTKAKLAQARYNVLLGGLKLRQANGTLRAEDLQQVNALLAN